MKTRSLGTKLTLAVSAAALALGAAACDIDEDALEGDLGEDPLLEEEEDL